MIDGSVFLILCVLNGWISVDDFNTGFPIVFARVLQSAVLRMIESYEGEFPEKKPKNLKNWWDDEFYENKPKRLKEPRHAPTTRLYERIYRGRRLLPPQLGGEL